MWPPIGPTGATRYDGRVTNDQLEPGDRRTRLDRPPGERYGSSEPEAAADPTILDRLAWPVAVILGTAVAFTILGGILAITAGLIVIAAFAGWLMGKLVSPPPRAAVLGLVAVAAGFLGIWAFGRLEGGVLDPITYLDEVEGWIVVVACLLAGGGLAAASSR
jgi:hypothetical protein